MKMFVQINGDPADLDWTLRGTESKYACYEAASDVSGPAPVSGFNLVFSSPLTPAEKTAVDNWVATPGTWWPVGSYSKGTLPKSDPLAGKRIVWVHDVDREGGGVGAFAFWDGKNWLRLSDNEVIA